MNSISSRTIAHLSLLLVNGYSFTPIKRIFTSAGVPLEFFDEYEQTDGVSKSTLVNETLNRINALPSDERHYCLSEIIEDVLVHRAFGPIYPDDVAYQRSLLKLEKSLKLDGLEIHEKNLVPIIDRETVEEENALEKKLRSLGFNVVIHHLNMSKEHYVEGQWDSANGQTRKALEQILFNIAEKIAIKNGESIPSRYGQPRPREVRKYLLDKGFLNDKEHELLNAFYQFASERGGHPGLSTEIDSRLRRFLLIGLCQYYVEKILNY